MRSHHGAWAAGVLLAGGAAWLAVRGFETAAIGLGTTAIAVALLTPARSVPPELPDDASQAPGDALASLCAALRLGGRGIIVPGGGEEPSMLFVPASEAGDRTLPPLHREVVIYRDPSGPMGVQIPPPGAGLEGRWRALHGLPTGRGIEEAALHLRKAMLDLALGRSVVVARHADAVRVSYEPLAFKESCERSRSGGTSWHLQGGCPACSFVAIIVARSVRSPVQMEAAGSDGRRVVLDVRVRP